MKDSSKLFGPAAAAAIAAVAVLSALTGGCGSSGSRKSPTPPTVIIHALQLLVDVGQQAVVDARDSFDPEKPNEELGYFWSLLGPSVSDAQFQDHCTGDSIANGTGEVCTSNDDMTCVNDSEIACTTNADCPSGDFCDPDSGTGSSQCPDEVRCLTGESRTMEYATFVPDVGGAYEVRLLVQANDANNIGTLVIGTNPSLFLAGPLFEFGGTLGGFVKASSDAQTFAAGATAGVSSPVDGNILLAVPSPPRVREFNFRDGTIIGTFGETGDFSVPPVALAFDADENLNVAYSDGVVRVFDGGNGLFIGNFGLVAGGGQSVAAMAFSPFTGELFVVDGAAGQALRVYNPDGSFSRSLPDTAAATTRAIDLVFNDDPTLDLLIADAGGSRIVRCDADGTNCANFGDTATLLAGTIPTGITVNPAIVAVPEAEVLITDGGGRRVIGCSTDGTACSQFGDTQGLASSYLDLFFAPTVSPSTTTTTIPQAVLEEALLAEEEAERAVNETTATSTTSTTAGTGP